MQSGSTVGLPELVDLQAFPIHDPASATYVTAVDAARAGLRSEGCAVLSSFVRPDAVARLNEEILERKHATHYSLHRVTRVGAGSRPRHASIFAYTLEPGVIGRVERTRQLFGRVLAEHEEAERRRVRSDALLD